jgi:peptidoglycan/LPS O-acetylase OafA/YrhL
VTEGTPGPEARPVPVSSLPAGRPRLAGLDGVRGLAALFVVLHHCWLLSYPGSDNLGAPVWTSWLGLGHLAVVVFIVLSGFSLAVGPARDGWRLGGMRRFLRRRAWRILPPYWAALAFSVIVAWTVVPQPGTPPPNVKSVVVHGLLLQDVIGSPSPNGAFWSIAIEAQLYLVLPLLLLVQRRAGAGFALALVLLPALMIEMLSGHVPGVALFQRFIPQMAVLFTLGVVAARAVAGDRPGRFARFAPALAVITGIPPIAAIALLGVTWTLDHYFWVDLALGPAIALSIVALSWQRPMRFMRLLDTRPLRALGSYSYSLYLVHAPIVVALYAVLVAPRIAPGNPALLVMLGLVAPIAVLGARLFAAVFELPFQRHRSWKALREAAWSRARRPTLRAAHQTGRGDDRSSNAMPDGSDAVGASAHG